MPASVETFTNTQEFLRTNVSIFVTLMLSFGPTWAASVCFAPQAAWRPSAAEPPNNPRSQVRRSMGEIDIGIYATELRQAAVGRNDR